MKATGLPSAGGAGAARAIQRQAAAGGVRRALLAAGDRRLGRNRDIPEARASELLTAAGYGDGGKPLNVEILSFEDGFDRIILPYIDNLKRIGVDASLRRVDPAQYERRMKSFDFDVTIERYALRLTPGVELKSYWGSDAAAMDGSFNLAGIKDPVVDALIDKMVRSQVTRRAGDGSARPRPRAARRTLLGAALV